MAEAGEGNQLCSRGLACPQKRLRRRFWRFSNANDREVACQMKPSHTSHGFRFVTRRLQ